MTWTSMNDILKQRTEEELLELDRYGRPAQPTSEFIRPTSGEIGSRFLLESPLDRLSATERTDYRSGEWLGADA